MKRFFKNLLFSILLCFTPIIKCEAPAGAGLGIADAFKDLSEAELLKAIEESQKALVDLMENGTPEQKAEFEKALTELAENLSPEDWKELQAIGEVYEKNNPYVPQEAPKEATKEVTTEKKPEVKAIPAKVQNTQFESSMKETLDLIIKNIDKMFHVLSAHRDLNHKLKLWEEKSSFQELKSLLIRLKKHINRLSKTSDPENKIIIDNLHAFKKDLEAENKKIALMQDDFGLENPMTSEQSDHTLTRVTLVLSTGINNLLPSLTAFFKKYEPEALEEAKKKDAQKAKAKEHEKAASQRRPSNPYFSTAPSHSGRNDSYNQMPQRRHRPSDMQNGFHQGGAAKGGAQKEHKADFGGFNMNITRGTISGGRAIATPEKKKDEKDKDKKDSGNDSDKKEADKKAEAKKIEINQNFIKGITELITKTTTKLAGSRFKEELNRPVYSIFVAAAPTAPVNLTPGIRNALTAHLGNPPKTFKVELLKEIRAASLPSSPKVEDIIKKQSDLILTAIEPLLDDVRQAIHDAADNDKVAVSQAQIQDLLNNEDIKNAIEEATQELSLNREIEVKERNSTANMKNFTMYANTLDSNLRKYSAEINEILTIINSLQPAIGKVPQAELSKFIKNPIFINFENKVKEYEAAVKEFKMNADKQKTTNWGIIVDKDKNQYQDIHKSIIELPEGMAAKITSAIAGIAAFKQSISLPSFNF